MWFDQSNGDAVHLEVCWIYKEDDKPIYLLPEPIPNILTHGDELLTLACDLHILITNFTNKVSYPINKFSKIIALDSGILCSTHVLVFLQEVRILNCVSYDCSEVLILNSTDRAAMIHIVEDELVQLIFSSLLAL